MVTERQTAQEHLDFWIEVMNEPVLEGQGSAQKIELRSQAKRELRYWRRKVRMEYEAARKAAKSS